MRFESWEFAFLALLPFFLIKFGEKKNTPALLRFPSFHFATKKGFNPIKLSIWVFSLLWVLLIFTLMRPQESFKREKRTAFGSDIILLLDVSLSMNIEDLSNRSRIDVAKETLKKFVEARVDDRIGLVIFSGEPLTMAPPTLDYDLVKKVIDLTDLGMLKDGTGIGDGLGMAIARLKNSQAKSRIIILATDGENNVGQLDPLTAVDLAAGYGIKIYTIAVGREGRVRLPIKRKDVFGRTVTTYQWFDNQLNPELLQEAARRTQARFFTATNEDEFKQIFTEIDKLEKTKIEAQTQVRYQEKFQFPLLLAMALLVLEKCFAWTRWRIL